MVIFSPSRNNIWGRRKGEIMEWLSLLLLHFPL